MPQVSNGTRYSETSTSARRVSTVQSGRRSRYGSGPNRYGPKTQQQGDRSGYPRIPVTKPLPDVPVEKKWNFVPRLCCISRRVGGSNFESVRPSERNNMPNIKGRVNDFFHRQLSLVTPAPASEQSAAQDAREPARAKPKRSHSLREESTNQPVLRSERTKKAEASNNSRREKPSSGTFITRYLNGNLTKSHPDIICGKTCYDLPVKEIDKLSKSIVAAYTGPGLGLTAINNTHKTKAFKPPVDDVDFIDEDIDFDDSDMYLEGGKKSTSEKSPAARKSPSTYRTSFSPIFKSNFEALIDDELDGLTANDNLTRQSNPPSTCTSQASGNQPSTSSVSPPAPEPADNFIAGIDDWQRPSSPFAFGISTSLYESHPTLKERAGEPVADSFGICVRENSAILALADGVNWGEKASLASRCAINGCLDYLNQSLYHESSRVENTMDIFVCLLRSFSAAHDLILQEKGMLTTLTVAFVAQLKHSEKFIVCTCNVGDSLAYVYSMKHGVREVTQGSHDIFSMRDMRDALGALGPVDGQNPELNNLTVAMTIVEKGDIVFLTSDGVSDNFDPVVGKFAIPQKKDDGDIDQKVSKVDEPDGAKSQNSEPNTKSRSYQVRLKRSNSNPDRDSAHRPSPDPGLPVVSAEQRHELTLLRMEDIVKNGLKEVDRSPDVTARSLCESLIEFASKLTTAKRRTLEDPELYKDDEEFGQREQRRRRRKVGEKLLVLPGKLDHASVVAYKVGFRGRMAGTRFSSKSKDYDKRHDLKLKASLAKFTGSQDDFVCISSSESP